MSSATPAPRQDGLLAIDVGAEIRHLCEEQLQGPWQVPAELVRLAIATGAGGVEVNLSRRGLQVTFGGSALAGEVLRQIAIALDRCQPPGARQRAITSLEGSGAHALLWAAGLPGASLRVTSSTEHGSVRLALRRGGRPDLTESSSAIGAHRTEIRVTGARVDADRARRWLHAACRFTPRPVVIDGAPAARGFPDGLYRMSVTRPLPAQVAVTATGEAPRLWLLQHGVVAARASVPRYPAFHAAVEMGEVVPANASAADFRAAVTPFLGELVDAAVELMILVARKLPELDDVVRQRVVLLLLRAARMRLREEQIRSMQLLDVARPGAGRGRPMAVDELAGLAEAGAVYALAPEDDRRRFSLDAGTVLLLTTEQRRLVAELGAVRLGQPPVYLRPGLVRRFVVRGASGLGAWLAEPWSRLRRLLPRRALADAELGEGEHQLTRWLQEALGNEAEVRMCSGSGPVRRSGGGGRNLLLPRDNIHVRRSVRVAHRGVVWAYPVLLALGAGREPPAEACERWLGVVLGGIDSERG